VGAGGAVFVNENEALVAPLTDAVTVYGPPAMEFAVALAKVAPPEFVGAGTLKFALPKTVE
jgi:hypothetical protein